MGTLNRAVAGVLRLFIIESVTREISQLLWSKKVREEWFSLRENHVKLFGSGLHQLRNRYHISATVFLLSLLLAAGCDRGDHPRQVGKPAPDFTISDDGRSLRLSNYRGKGVLLNFWASCALRVSRRFPRSTSSSARCRRWSCWE